MPAWLAAMLLAGCAFMTTRDDSETAGVWESPTSGATLEFRADGTFAASAYPVGRAEGTEANSDDFRRSSFDGTWSAGDDAFIYNDTSGEQLWEGRTASGTPTLTIIWDIESGRAIDTYVKQPNPE